MLRIFVFALIVSLLSSSVFPAYAMDAAKETCKTDKSIFTSNHCRQCKSAAEIEAVEQQNHPNAPSVEEIYHVGACEFASQFIANIEQYITKQEFDAIKAGKHICHKAYRSPVLTYLAYLIYKHDGIRIESTYQNGDPLIFVAWFAGERLPKEMQDKNFFYSKFNLNRSSYHKSKLAIGCEGWEMKISFDKNKTTLLKITSSVE